MADLSLNKIFLKYQQKNDLRIIKINMNRKKDIKSLSYKELEKIITLEGFPSYRTKQIFFWLYQKKVKSFSQMNNLPQTLIVRLNSIFQLRSIYCVEKLKSKDGSIKFIFRLCDNNLIESVLIRGEKRNTVCLSSQVGCLWHCLFCASGKGGFTRNLLEEEIIEQLLEIQRISGEHVNNIVFMGMGEPFNNYERLMKSINIINEKFGINIGARKITISTCGIIPGIERFSKNPLQVELSVSLHAAENDIRTKLMPVNRRYPLMELIAACRDYVNKKNRQITFEYLMLGGINDSLEQAKKLCYLISDFKSKVNLIIYNPISRHKQPALSPSDNDSVIAFQNVLKRNHIPVTIRYSKGQDIEAACGQLISNYLGI